MTIQLYGESPCSMWSMQIDLQYVVDHAGKYESYYDVTNRRNRRYIPFTKTQARKIFKLIKFYGTKDTIQTADLFLSKYEDLHKIWEGLK